MDRQAVFTKVRNHLLAQNAKSKAGDSGQCLYRGANGTKCAIGALLPDEACLGNKNFMSVRSLAASSMSACAALGNPNEQDLLFLEHLQGIHDCTPVAMWGVELEEFARRYGLEY